MEGRGFWRWWSSAIPMNTFATSWNHGKNLWSGGTRGARGIPLRDMVFHPMVSLFPQVKSADRLLIPLLLCGRLIFGAFLPRPYTHLRTVGRYGLRARFARDFSSTMREYFHRTGSPPPARSSCRRFYSIPLATFGDLVWLRLFGLMLTLRFCSPGFFLPGGGKLSATGRLGGSPGGGGAARPGGPSWAGVSAARTVIGFNGRFSLSEISPYRSGELDAAKSTLSWKPFCERCRSSHPPVLCLYHTRPPLSFSLPALFAWFLRQSAPSTPKHMNRPPCRLFRRLGILFHWSEAGCRRVGSA